MATAQQAARITDPITHGLGLIGIAGGMLVGAVAGVILIARLACHCPGAAGGIERARLQPLAQWRGGGPRWTSTARRYSERACALPSPTTGMVGAVGSPNVRIGNLPAARVVSDVATSCNGLYALSHLPIPPLPQAQIAEGAQHTIRINGLFGGSGFKQVNMRGEHTAGGPHSFTLGGRLESASLAVFTIWNLCCCPDSGLLPKASLIAMSLLTIPLGVGAMATICGCFRRLRGRELRAGVGWATSRLGPDGVTFFRVGSVWPQFSEDQSWGQRRSGKSEPAIEPAELNQRQLFKLRSAFRTGHRRETGRKP